MATFTVRIELHDGQWSDYETLHAAMQRQGFSRLITSDQGQTYHLPWAEYDASGNVTSAQVLAIAQNAAGATGKKHSILVTEVKSRAWSGLALAGNRT
jgi:hypothetical protein